MTVLAAVVTAAAGWILVTGFCVLGWISVPQIKASSVLQLGTQGWLLAHGISVGLPGAQLSIMPLGLTLLIIAIGLGACQQAVLHSQPPANGQVGIRVARMGLAFGLTYIILIGVGRGWTEGDRAGQASLLTAVVLVFGLGLVASARALGWRPEMPSWVKGAGLAVSAGLAVLVVGGAAVFVAALVAGNNR
ncbi:MAG: cell division protein PerM, partial [Brooklawnia sp.]